MKTGSLNLITGSCYLESRPIRLRRSVCCSTPGVEFPRLIGILAPVTGACFSLAVALTASGGEQANSAIVCEIKQC